MAETTGSATGLEDFFAKFLTWVATVSGWTVDQSISTVASARQCAISKGGLHVQFRWNTASPNSVIVTQSTAFVAATQAGLMTGDSGSGYNTNTATDETSITGERCIELMGNGAYPSYYLYSNAAGDYLHVAVEISTGTWRHFGCGNLLKFANWNTMTGGEYAYGQVGATASSSVLNTSSILLDGGASLNTTAAAANDRAATMRLAGAPNQSGAGVWANVWGNRGVTELNDTAGNVRATCIGGARSGPLSAAIAWIKAGSSSGLAPTLPISVFYINKTPSPNRAYLLGFMKDVRAVHLRYMAPKDTFVLGADTWRVFPTVRRVEGAAAGDTDFQGWAYNASA